MQQNKYACIWALSNKLSPLRWYMVVYYNDDAMTHLWCLEKGWMKFNKLKRPNTPEWSSALSMNKKWIEVKCKNATVLYSFYWV